MDISRFDTKTGSEAGAWVRPIDPMGQEIGIKILVAGPDSKRYAAAKDRVQKEVYEQLQAVAARKAVDMETDADREARFFAEITLGWEPTDAADPITWEGEPFDFSPDNALKLYTFDAMIRNQVKAFAESRKNFLKPGSEISPTRSGGKSSSTRRGKTAH